MHPSELKPLISAWKNEPKHKRIIDSSESQIKELLAVIKTDSFQISACEKVNQTQNLLIGAHEAQTQELKGDLKKETLWKRFWKTTTGIVIILGSGYEVYQTIKP